MFFAMINVAVVCTVGTSLCSSHSQCHLCNMHYRRSNELFLLQIWLIACFVIAVDNSGSYKLKIIFCIFCFNSAYS